jgi:hypothetical protein
MSESLYLVAIVDRANLAALGRNEVLTELICPVHYTADMWVRRASAKEIAMLAVKHRYPNSAKDIGYISASRFAGDVPTRAADFCAPCNCLAWYGRGY